jgi:hypothetical protein
LFYYFSKNFTLLYDQTQGMGGVFPFFFFKNLGISLNPTILGTGPDLGYLDTLSVCVCRCTQEALTFVKGRNCSLAPPISSYNSPIIGALIGQPFCLLALKDS